VKPLDRNRHTQRSFILHGHGRRSALLCES
jgi:hypothetical protein